MKLAQFEQEITEFAEEHWREGAEMEAQSREQVVKEWREQRWAQRSSVVAIPVAPVLRTAENAMSTLGGNLKQTFNEAPILRRKESAVNLRNAEQIFNSNFFCSSWRWTSHVYGRRWC